MSHRTTHGNHAGTTTLKSRRTGEDLRERTGADFREDRERKEYILRHAPTVLAALVVRRGSTDPDQLVEQAIDGVRKIYDIVHELDTPATTMLSQPVDGAR